MDLHAAQIQGFFNIPVDNLYAAPVLLDYIQKKYDFDNLVIVSPDAGGVERARAFAKKLECSIAIIDKRREKANVSQIMNVIGDVENKDTLLLDDMVDTGGTTAQAAGPERNRAQKGFGRLYPCGAFGCAIERVNNSVMEELIVTNTIPLDSKKELCKKLTVLSIAPLARRGN